MEEETILGLPKTVINSDDELMGISIYYDEDDEEWTITYADEGSSITATAKTLKKVVKAIKKVHKDVYGEEL